MNHKGSETEATEDLGFVKAIRNKMISHNFMLCFRGSFTQPMINSILNVAERKLEDTNFTTRKKVFNIMVECLQNICKSEESHEDGLPLFMLGRSEDSFIIFSGNTIEKEAEKAIAEKLKEINKLSESELKDLYRSIITKKEDFDIHESGLGLIEIAKKSNSKLDYSFKEVDDSRSYFSLKTVLKNT